MNGENIKVNPDSEAGNEPPQGVRPRRFARLAWLPIPLLVVGIIAGRMAGLQESYKSEILTLVLSFTFYTLVSLGTLFLIGRSFLALGTPGLLLLECGVLLWSLAGTVGDAVSHGDANVNVTIFNTAILLAGLCHLAGAIFSLRPQRALRSPPLWLGASCALVLGALWLIAQAALANWLPVFFIPGQGGTLVRYFVLISAITMFVLSAGLLNANQRAARLPFTSWYAPALLLLAVGLFGVMIQLSLGSVVNWLGRTAQWLGGVYLLFAALASLRESQLPLLPTEKKSHPAYYRDIVAVAVVIAAAAIRLTFLSAMGTQAPYVIFFPAVMFAAIYGGWRGGMLAMALSAILANYFWVGPVGLFPIGQPADQLALVVFLVSGVMIIWVSEAMRRARAQAFAAEMQALLAAEREATAEELLKSEEQYHDLFNTMEEGFCVIEMMFNANGRPIDYRFLEVNAAFEKQTGLHDAKDKLMRDLAPDHEEYWFEIFGKIALTGEPLHFGNEAKALNRWYDVYAYRVGQPEDQRVAIVFNDITERKHGEDERARLLAEVQNRAAVLNATISAVATGLIVYDTAGKAIRLNDIVKELFPAELFFNKTIEERHRAVRWETENGQPFPLEEIPVACALRGETKHNVVIAAPFPDHKLWISASAAPIRTPDGKLLGAVASFIDITERKRAEEALQKANTGLEIRVQERTFELSEAYETLQREVDERKKAEDQLIRRQKLEALGTLAGGIAHDFNNILAGIIGFTEMVLEDIYPDGPEYKRLGLALKGAYRGRDLVRQILTFSRQTAQDRKPLAFRQVVEEGLKLLRPTIPSTIEIVSTSITDDDSILADPVQMHQVLMNLCTNAAHAMREKGGVLTINISETSLSKDSPAPVPDMKPGEYVVLKVSDTGCGMEPETLERIFDPFFTTKEQGEGTGLGLSVAHGIIKSHGGYVTVESKPGKGTTFQIYLPRIKKQTLSKDGVAPVTTGGNERILIVDDEDILIELNQQRLSKLGYNVVATTSSTDALDIFRKEPDTFDLVITDQTMPNLTGMDLATELLKIRASIPIILCTGHSETVSPEQAKKSGIRAFLMKPLGKQELAQVIRRLLDTGTEK
jgi:signal transduction histidine kinase/ActR/RegA family two-component response regulator